MPAKLYVGNLPETCSEDAIRDLFTSYGDITELAVKTNFAFVHFKHDEDAANAVRDLNGTKMLGKKINVEISKSKKDGRFDRRNNPRRDFNNHQNRSFNRALECGPPPNLIAPPAIGDLGLLSAVTTLVAAAERQRSITQRNMDPPREQKMVPDSRNARSDQDDAEGCSSKNNGFVIYERYYVDPSHPLLNGLPIPKLPHVQGSNYSDPSHRDNNCNYDDEYRR